MRQIEEMVPVIEQWGNSAVVGKLILNKAPGGGVLPWFVQVLKARELDDEIKAAAELIIAKFGAARVEVFPKGDKLDRIEVVTEL